MLSLGGELIIPGEGEALTSLQVSFFLTALPPKCQGSVPGRVPSTPAPRGLKGEGHSHRPH